MYEKSDAFIILPGGVGTLDECFEVLTWCQLNLIKNKKVGIIIDELGLKQITDTDTITKIVTDVLASNPESIELHKSGKDRAFGFLVGQIMKASQGQANPQIVNKILKEELDKLC